MGHKTRFLALRCDGWWAASVSPRDLGLCLDYQTYRLTHAELACARYCSVSSRIILVQTDDCLHYTRVLSGRIRVKINHHAPQIAHRYVHYRAYIVAAKHSPAADPTVLQKWFCRIRRDYNIGSKSPGIQVLSYFPTDSRNRC